jgi:hypothetical protein
MGLEQVENRMRTLEGLEVVESAGSSDMICIIPLPFPPHPHPSPSPLIPYFKYLKIFVGVDLLISQWVLC